METLNMYVEIIDHPSGDQLPILLDSDGLPIPMPSEFVMGRRALGINTLVRNLRELLVLYRWLEKERIDLWDRIVKGRAFTEAEIRGGLIESLRRDQSQDRKVKKLTVTPNSFNQRLTTIRQFIGLHFDIYLGSISFNDTRYEYIREQKVRTISWLNSSFISAPPINASKQKGLTLNQAMFLLNYLEPKNDQIFGRDPSVHFRNYVSVMIMLNYGLRPGELLSLKVEDIEFGAISAIKVERRQADPKDKRKPRPHIKRNGRVMPIDNPNFAKYLDEYIMTWREKLEAKATEESEYLILSDEGKPLSQPSVVQFFQILRNRFPDDLPSNLSAKSLRHTFSSNMERMLKGVGMDEVRRSEALADLRGDSSLSSQEVYIAQEIQEQANKAMRNYHNKLLG
jgi:integrase